jgi:hypothetical protein
MSVPMAIALSGQLLLGQPVMVKPSEAEKNLVQSNASSGAAGVVGPYGAVDRKLYVGNLHFNMTEANLREVCVCFVFLLFHALLWRGYQCLTYFPMIPPNTIV